MKKLNIIVALITLALMPIMAQEKGHYISIDGGGGMESFFATFDESYKSGCSQNLGLGGRVGLRYTCFINKHWGVGLGVGAHMLSGKVSYTGEDSFMTRDADNEEYLRLTYYDNVSEKQSSWMLDVPLFVAFQTEMAPKWTFLLDFGLKVSVPLETTNEVLSGNISTKGYYESTHVTLETGKYDLTRHGFTSTDVEDGEKFKLDILGSAFININFSYEMAKNCEFYFGVYADYGINSFKLNTLRHAFEPADLDRNVNKFSGFYSSNMINTLNSISVGPQVGFRFRLAK